MKLKLTFILLLLLLPSTLALEDDCLYYFFGQRCEDCDLSTEHINSLARKYPQLNIQTFEVHANDTNYNILQDYFEAYNVPTQNQGVPAVFMWQSYFVGSDTIEELLENRIIDNKRTSCPTLTNTMVVGLVGAKNPSNVLETVTTFGVIFGAIADVVSKHGIALLLVLLLLILLSQARNLYLFPLSSVFVLLLYAFGFFDIPSMLSSFVATIIALCSLGVSILLIYNFLMGKETTLPKSLHGAFPKITSSLGVFATGFATTLLTLQFTGDNFDILRIVITDTAMRWSAFLILLVYLVSFALLQSLIIWLSTTLHARRRARATRQAGYSKQRKEVWDKHAHDVSRVFICIAIFILSILSLIQ